MLPFCSKGAECVSFVPGVLASIALHSAAVPESRSYRVTSWTLSRSVRISFSTRRQSQGLGQMQCDRRELGATPREPVIASRGPYSC